MSSSRSSSKGVWRLTARWHSLSLRKRCRPAFSPTVETVMRLGLMARPQGAVSTVRAARTESMLSMGSPIPMSTMLVRLADSSTLIVWFTMLCVDRLPPQGCLPVAQKAQPILQPTWHEMQRVRRSVSGIMAVSIVRAAPAGNRYLRVPS